jgi:hypothetical protein
MADPTKRTPKHTREYKPRKYFLFAAALAFTVLLVLAFDYFRPTSRLGRRIKAEINAKWPPAKDLTGSQLRAMHNALENLEKGRFPSADMYLGVSKAALQETVSSLVIARVPQVKRVSIELGRQDIIANLEFELTHSKPALTLKGSAVVHNFITITNGTWMITQLRVK